MADQISSPEPVKESSPSNAEAESGQPIVRSLKELIDLVSGRNLKTDIPEQESGLAETLPFPFLGLVGQLDMKVALLLSVINPNVGGVLLIGPRGTGKTTAVRSLLNLLPDVQRSACFYGCTPEDIETGGVDAVCPDCAKKYGEGRPLTVSEPARLVELPLNAKLEDVVGGLDERAVIHERLRLKRGIMAHADQNILFVDEVNLLTDEIVDAILDASALGTYTVRRGPISATYNARFVLVSSMNPEEGNLRPQILDRFGLRVIVRGLAESAERFEAYRRTRTYREHPRLVIQQYAFETSLARQEIQQARTLLPKVEIPTEIADAGIRLIQHLQIDSLRAEISLFEAARAYAAADSRTSVTIEDLRTIAPLALRLRHSEFMSQYFAKRASEDEELYRQLEGLAPAS
jgi:magnesium chelatase subunit I